MYGEIVITYEIAVHFYTSICFSAREGHTHKGHRRPSPTVMEPGFAKTVLLQRAPCAALFVGVVVEIALDVDDGSALVAGAGSQITE